VGSCPGGISTGVLASPVRAYAYDYLGFGWAVSRYSSNAFRTATNRAPRLAVPERLMEQSKPLSAIVDGERHWLISPCCKRPAGRRTLEGSYVRWLRARAALFDPDTSYADEEGEARQNEVDEDARALLIAPAFFDHMVWRKWEAGSFSQQQPWGQPAGRFVMRRDPRL
jgi:hypothetical protein